MTKTDGKIVPDEVIKAKVTSELEEAKEFAKSLSTDDIKSGKWLVILLHKVAQAYDKNATSQYFLQKYPGLPLDEIAEKLVSITVRHATIAGAITGAAMTANMIATLSSFGMTAALMVGAIGAEMLYLARIQMRLVLDLAVLYDLQLDKDDPEDMMMILGYAMGVAPTELVGKGVQVATRGATEYAVKKYVSKGSLKALQDFGKKIGIRILQRSVLKYTVPVVSAVVGSSYNYVTTKALGKIAQSHMSNRGQVTEELRLLVSRQNTYTIAFPAAAMYMAQIDGEVSAKEKEFYRALLSRMSFEHHAQAEFQKLLNSEENILEAIAQLKDAGLKNSLLEVLILMAVYDGKLVEVERDFLIKTASSLDLPLDIDDVERRARDYQIAVEKSIVQKATGSTKDTASKVKEAASKATGNVKGAATVTGHKITEAFGQIFKRKKDEAEN